MHKSKSLARLSKCSFIFNADITIKLVQQLSIIKIVYYNTVDSDELNYRYFVTLHYKGL